ncbi:MAG: histidinol dehydrogenase [Spirochaetaceae bacterium]|jgi:histidinol dehydrogenase|nr:histidinol dehydrogenase [Spirochaetaceae bacterium]
MKINRNFWCEMDLKDRETFLKRSEIDIADVSEKVQEILDRVKEQGDKALLHYNHLFDKAPKDMTLKVNQEEMDEALTALDPKIKKALDYSIKNIRQFHLAQKPEAMKMMEIRPGILAGEKSSPIESCGLYVPRGRGSFPSMLYMLAIPAQVAEVPRICLVTPPDSQGKIDPATAYAAKQCGVTEIHKVGGAQAIAALAYGTESISV